jgi:hypothetical protein
MDRPVSRLDADPERPVIVEGAGSPGAIGTYRLI